MISTKIKTTVPTILNKGLAFAGKVLINRITRDQIESYMSLVSHITAHKGHAKCVKQMKEYQHYVAKTTMGLSPEPLEFHKIDKDNFPKVLKPWKDLILSTDCNDLREVNTLFGAVKLMKAPLDYDTSSITDEFNGDYEFLVKFTNFIKTWKFPTIGLEPEEYYNSPLRTTIGPNGRASATTFKDMDARYRSNDGPVLINSIVNRIGTSKDVLLSITWNHIMITVIAKTRTLEEEQDLPVHSRISFLQDKAGKTRVVAIGDHWSQSALYPIHKLFMKGRKIMNTDCTYRHNHLSDTLKYYTSNSKFVGTVDSTAFTDRLPTIPQKQVVSNVLGESIAESWLNLLTEREFTAVKGNKDKTKLSYSVGQPIGIYSSWAVGVTTLHALVEYSAYIVGKPNYRKYLVLGDDLSIFDEEVYFMTIKNLNRLGIQTNLDKSTVSTYSAEIAKQYFLKGENITGFPIDLLIQLERNPRIVLEFLKTVDTLGFEPVKADNVLSIMPKRYKRKALKLLSCPKVLGYPSSVSFDAHIVGYQNTWNQWTEGEIVKAYQYAKYDKFFRELEKITDLVNSEESDNTASTSHTFDPVINNHLMVKFSELKKWLDDYHASDNFMCEVSDEDIYQLRNIPIYDKYRYRSKKSTIAQNEGHVALLALKRLNERDISLPTCESSVNKLLTAYWAKSTGKER